MVDRLPRDGPGRPTPIPTIVGGDQRRLRCRSASTPITVLTLADRYDLGGLPTTAFLTPAGDVLGGGTFVPPDRLREALARLADASGRTPDVPAQLPTFEA